MNLKKIFLEVLKEQEPPIDLPMPVAAVGGVGDMVGSTMPPAQATTADFIKFPKPHNFSLYIDRRKRKLKFTPLGESFESNKIRIAIRVLSQWAQENRYKIKPVIKNYVSFRIADLLKPFNAVKFDLISCRNFLIYISKERQRVVVQNLVKNLQPYGYLILGKTEGFPLLSTKMFSPENIREHIYKFK